MAYFVYSDGLSTLIDTVLVFAVEELCMTFDDTITLLIITDFTSCIGAFLSENIVEKKILSTKKTVMAAISIIALLPFFGHPSLPVFTSDNHPVFYAFAGIFGICNGATGALSRSLFIRFIPKGKEHEFFGFYELTDKGTSWLGPLIIAIVIDVTGSLRLGFFSIFFFMFFGVLLLARVDVEKSAKLLGR